MQDWNGHLSMISKKGNKKKQKKKVKDDCEDIKCNIKQ